MARIAINGFGRIGRLFFRAAFDTKGIDIVAINDLGDGANLAYLCKHDSVYRTWDRAVTFEDKSLIVDRKVTKFLQEKDPTKLPWRDLGIDIVVESTGIFDSYEKAKMHLTQGAKHVVITAPAKDEDGIAGKTVLMGVNEDEANTCAITSNASCTTNSASPVITILNEAIGIEKAMLSTVHAYTATQSVVDSIVKGEDYRRGRAAAENISPSTTGAATAVTRVVKDLSGKFDGIAFRVPVEAGSISDITFLAKRKTTVDEINSILKKAAGDERWHGIFTVTEEQLVSSDIIGEPYGAIADLRFTKVVDGDFIKVLSWYDNEWGYVSTLVRHVQKVTEAL